MGTHARQVLQAGGALRVVVCGTNYGAHYVHAIARAARRFQLLGIVARGSERSRDLARRSDVPLFRSSGEVPEGVELACVAVGGRAGEEVALEFLSRGIHVLSEHPVGSGFLRRALRQARRSRALCHVNSHFSDLDESRRFLRCCAEASSRSRLRFLLATFSRRTLFSGIEILGRIAGGLRPRRVESAARLAPSSFASLQAVLRKTPASLLVDTRLSANDDGSDMHIGHRIVAGFEDENVTLVNSFGPVIRSTHPPGPRASVRWKRRTWLLTGSPQPSTWEEFVTEGRVAANLRALDRLRSHILTGETPTGQEPAYLCSVAETWEAIERRLSRITPAGARSSN